MWNPFNRKGWTADRTGPEDADSQGTGQFLGPRTSAIFAQKERLRKLSAGVRFGRVVIRGQVTNLSTTESWNTGRKVGLEFRVIPDDNAGSLLQQVHVKAKGSWILGYVHEKDHVEVGGKWKESKYLMADFVKNLTTGSTLKRPDWLFMVLFVVSVLFAIGAFLFAVNS